MSNFLTKTPFVSGIPGFAPVYFSGSTEDDLATITTVGYLNDLGVQGVVKQNDIWQINYDVDTSISDPLSVSTAATFRVDVVGTDYSLVAYP